MKNYSEHIDDLIGLVLTGEATEEQIRELDSWRAMDAENEVYFQHLKTVYERSSAAVNAWPDLDVDAAWKLVEAKLGGGGQVRSIRAQRPYRWLQVAASLVLLLGAAIWLFSRPQHEQRFAMQSANEVVSDTLPDGSVATLNRNSHLEYAQDKSGERLARLKGEAYFRVKHSDEDAFVIDAGDVFIRDVGTIFNVSAPEGSDSVVVFVREGIVDFYTKDNSGLRLLAGEEAIYRRSVDRFEKRIPQDENVSSYADRTFHFSNTPVRRVIRRLNEVYQSNIQLDNASLGDCRLTVSFENDDLEVVVDIIAETMNWQVMKLPNGYVFMGEKCGGE